MNSKCHTGDADILGGALLHDMAAGCTACARDETCDHKEHTFPCMSTYLGLRSNQFVSCQCRHDGASPITIQDLSLRIELPGLLRACNAAKDHHILHTWHIHDAAESSRAAQASIVAQQSKHGCSMQGPTEGAASLHARIQVPASPHTSSVRTAWASQ